MTTCKCDNCDWTGNEDDLGADLSDTPNLSDRLTPGEEVPAGECPECGALAYIQKLSAYTVLLQRPDYVSDETYLTHVAALTPRLALDLARAEACAADEVHPDDATDYLCLLVVEGAHNDLNPEL